MKTLTEIPEWMNLKRVVLTAGAELPGEIFNRLFEAFNETATALTAKLCESSFTIGPGNTWPQAWAAMLAGHQVRLPDWKENVFWIFNGDMREIELVKGATKAEWFTQRKLGPSYMLVSSEQQLHTIWEVLPIIDHEPPTV